MKSLINHTTKVISLVLLVNIAILCQQDSTHSAPQPNDSVFVMAKSPWGAVLRSAVLPGLGQIYNESYWKAPVISGISAWLIYNWIDNNRLYKQNREEYLIAYTKASLSTDSRLTSIANQYRTNRDFYRDQRDLFSIYMGLTYLLNLVDAYVDAQLFDFTVDENHYTSQPMISIKYHF